MVSEEEERGTWIFRGGQRTLQGCSLPCLALLAVEDGEEAEHEGTTSSSKKPTPVIPHGKVG